MLDDVAIAPVAGWAGFAVASNGTVAFLPASATNMPGRLVWLERDGRLTPVLDTVLSFQEVRIAPDGRRIALGIGAPADVWTLDPGRALLSRVTRTSETEIAPVWTADGRELLVSREVPQFDLFRRGAEGGAPESVFSSSRNDKIATAVSPDGQLVLYTEFSPGGDIRVAPLDGGAARRLVAGPADDAEARFSPDGRWIAYQSSESGRPEVYAAALPESQGAARTQVSRGGGLMPRWGPGGRRIFYWDRTRLARAPFDPATGAVGTPVTAFETGDAHIDDTGYRSSYDVAPDGRVLLILSPIELAPREIRFVLGWNAELRRLVP